LSLSKPLLKLGGPLPDVFVKLTSDIGYLSTVHCFLLS
jgi:hypothetical protein